MEDTIASIRLRVKYRDAYEDWEHQTRKDAFVRALSYLTCCHNIDIEYFQNTARHERSASTVQRRQSQIQFQTHEDRRLAQLHSQQMEEVQAQLTKFKLVQEHTEKSLEEKWDKRSQAIWEGVEKVITMAEERVRKRLEAEEARRKAEEAARAKLLKVKMEREEAERKELEEKKKAQAEEMERQRVKKQQEEEQARIRNEQNAREKEQEAERRKLGLATALEDWQGARASLMVCLAAVFSRALNSTLVFTCRN